MTRADLRISCVSTYSQYPYSEFINPVISNKDPKNTLNHHPDLQDHPQLCSEHMDFVVLLVDRNNSISSHDYWCQLEKNTFSPIKSHKKTKCSNYNLNVKHVREVLCYAVWSRSLLLLRVFLSIGKSLHMTSVALCPCRVWHVIFDLFLPYQAYLQAALCCHEN